MNFNQQFNHSFFIRSSWNDLISPECFSQLSGFILCNPQRGRSRTPFSNSMIHKSWFMSYDFQCNVKPWSNALKFFAWAYYDVNSYFLILIDLPAAYSFSRSQLLVRLPRHLIGHPIDQSTNWCPNLKVTTRGTLFAGIKENIFPSNH